MKFCAKTNSKPLSQVIRGVIIPPTPIFLWFSIAELHKLVVVGFFGGGGWDLQGGSGNRALQPHLQSARNLIQQPLWLLKICFCPIFGVTTAKNRLLKILPRKVNPIASAAFFSAASFALQNCSTHSALDCFWYSQNPSTLVPLTGSCCLQF